MHRNIIFIVLVYRNTEDLVSFFSNNRVNDSHTIVVVSHYDGSSDELFRKIASDNKADCLFVQNKGYGYGNNKGIEYALNNYTFNYLIVSNADINIRHFDDSYLERYNNVIIAPEIVAANGKRQNPCEPYTPSRMIHYLMYITYKKDCYRLIWLFYAWARLKRIFFSIVNRIIKKKYIYSAHGSFVIIPVSVLQALQPLYNEKMFLMNEEAHLAKKAAKAHIKTVYAPNIIIDHKEDGSMSMEYNNEFKLLKQSFVEFYNYWYLDK